jgi:hypothetical protein
MIYFNCAIKYNLDTVIIYIAHIIISQKVKDVLGHKFIWTTQKDWRDNR